MHIAINDDDEFTPPIAIWNIEYIRMSIAWTIWIIDFDFKLSKILKNALLWDGVIDDINWEKTKHMIIIGEKDVNYQLTRKLLQNINGINLFILKEINHKNTFDIPNHSIDYIINFLEKGRKKSSL